MLTTQFPLPAPRRLGVAAAKLGYFQKRRPGVPLAASKLKDASTDEDVEPLSPPLAHSRRSRSSSSSSSSRGKHVDAEIVAAEEAGPATAASDAASDAESFNRTKLIASLGVGGGLVILVGGGILMKDQIKGFLNMFITLVDDWGPLGYAAYIAVYASLEILAVPAIPLTMTAGAIFGVVPGTVVVSVAATLACTGAFLIARYVARDRVQQFAASNPKFAAIDKAIGRNGFRVVALLRLSPLLPLAASNYLYGLTSVDLGSYVLGSWLGMLPGTAAYVAAGTYGKQLLEGGGGLEGLSWWQIAAALGASGLAVGYIARLASQAVAEMEAEEAEERSESNDSKPRW